MLALIIIALILGIAAGILVGEGEADGNSSSVAFGGFLAFFALVVGCCAYGIKQDSLRNLKLNSKPEYDVEVTTTTSPDGKVMADTIYIYHITADMLK